MPLGGIYLGGSNPRTPSAAEQRLKAARDRAARTFADALSSSLCNIFLLHPLVPGAHWIQYRILPWKRPRIEHRSRRGQFYELRVSQNETSGYSRDSHRCISVLVESFAQRRKGVMILCEADSRTANLFSTIDSRYPHISGGGPWCRTLEFSK